MNKLSNVFWGNKDKWYIRSIIFSAFSAFCFGTIYKANNVGPSLMALSVCGLILICCKYVICNRTESLVSAGIVSAILSAFTVVGNLATSNLNGNPIRFLGVNSFQNFVCFLGVWCFFFFIISAFFIWMSGHEISVTSKKTLFTNMRSWKRVLIFAGIIFVCYLPYLIVFYPGVVSNDSFNQISQVIGIRGYNNHHPVAQTFLIWICFRIAELFSFGRNTAVAIYSIGQMIFMAITFGFLCEYMIKKNAPKWFVILSLLFFALYPMTAVFAITMWKDFIFSCLVVLLVPCFIEMMQSKGEWLKKPVNSIMLLGLLLLIGVFRSNGVIIILLSMPFLILYIKYFRIRLTAITAIACVIIMLYQSVIIPALGIKTVAPTEALGLFVNQMCRVASVGRDLTDEQEELLYGLVGTDIASVYVPSGFDEVKQNPHYDSSVLNKNIFKFGKMWIDLSVKYPADMLEGYICGTLGFWYPDMENEITDIYVHKNDEGIYEAYPSRDLAAKVKTNLQPEMFYYNSFTLPFSSMAYFVWSTFILIAYCFYKHKGKMIIICLPVLATWLSIMLSTPYNHITRYIYPMFLALPILIFMYLKQDGQELNKNIKE